MLSSLTVDGGTALLPSATPPDQLASEDWAWLSGIGAAMHKAAGADVMVGAVAAEPGNVAAAAKVAREVLDVARGFGKPPGVYRIDDMLLEYQLSRPSEARDRLAALLDPLADNPELLETLVAYLRLGGRRPTAAALHVHPNTVDYRLRRVQALIGLDATRASDISLLEAAIAARRSVSPAD